MVPNLCSSTQLISRNSMQDSIRTKCNQERVLDILSDFIYILHLLNIFYKSSRNSSAVEYQEKQRSWVQVQKAVVSFSVYFFCGILRLRIINIIFHDYHIIHYFIVSGGKKHLQRMKKEKKARITAVRLNRLQELQGLKKRMTKFSESPYNI